MFKIRQKYLTEQNSVPCSTLPIIFGEVILSGGLFWGIPGLCMGGLGEDVQPGEGAGSDGDFIWTGDAPAEPIIGGDLMEAAAAAAAAGCPLSMLANCEGVCGDLRLPEGEPSMGDWTCRKVGDLSGFTLGELAGPDWTLKSEGLRPIFLWLGGGPELLGGWLEGKDGMWLRRPLPPTLPPR